MSYAVGKRAFDLTVAGIALIVAAPLLAIVALLVRWRLGRPVLFRQVRPGQGGKLFTIYKFRTMRDAYDRSGALAPDDQRLTAFGLWLRATSLDELPELWNIVRGDMSLVGPRPLLVEYLPRYSARQSLRHSVRPGLTGWAQIHGRNDVGWDEKLEMDAWYAEHATFWLDLKIMVRTLTLVVTRRGISAPGHATAPRFNGRNQS